MKQSDDFIFCKNFINDFISKYLKGNIQAWLDFDFASLRQDKQFGLIVAALIVTTRI